MENTPLELKGKSIVTTCLDDDQKETVKETAESLGAFVKSAVSGKTDILVVSDTDLRETVKYRKAKELIAAGKAITVIGYADFIRGTRPESNDFVIENGVLTKYTGPGGDVTVPEGVTSIGDSAFSWCESLKSITIQEGVTSIGNGAFRDCESLTEINVSDKNTVYASVDGVLFKKDLKELIACPNGRTGNYTIPEGVTSIGVGAFNFCSSLKSITIPDGITSIGNDAFWSCTSLTCITLPESLTNIGECAFGVCTSLTSITLPDSLTSIGAYAFQDCKGLTSITLPDSVTSIGDDAFRGCQSLTSITIPNSVTSIGDRAFRYCRSLTNITLPESVTSIGNGVFLGCGSLNSITLPEGLTSIGYGAFEDCGSLASITIPESMRRIDNRAFRGCNALTSVTIPKGVTNIGIDAFRDCKSLKYVIFPKSKTRIFTSDFLSAPLEILCVPGCSIDEVGEYKAQAAVGFALLSIQGYDFDGKISEGYETYIKRQRKRLYPMMIKHNAVQYLTDKKIIPYKQIDECIELVDKLGNVEAKAALMEYRNKEFGHKDVMDELKLYERKRSIVSDTLSLAKMRESFKIEKTDRGIRILEYKGASEVVIIPDKAGRPPGIPVTQISSSAFKGCGGITDIVIPGSVTWIGLWAFESCNNLTNITIPDSVTYIGVGAFYGCIRLKSITLPAGVTYIGNGAFVECPLLTIRAHAGSYAESYEYEHNIPFEAI